MIRQTGLLVANVFGLLLVTPPALAQEMGGVKIQGNTNINADANNMNTTAAGTDNQAVGGVGAIRGNTRIQGNTTINANAKNINTVAVGKGNLSTSDVGTMSFPRNFVFQKMGYNAPRNWKERRS
jgi:hypothetical protein